MSRRETWETREWDPDVVRHPIDAFPKVHDGEALILTATEKATDQFNSTRRHIFEPYVTNGRVEAYDSLCGRIPALRGECLVSMHPLKLLFSELLGGTRICHSCRNKAALDTYLDEDSVASFIEAGGEWPADDPPTILLGDERLDVPFSVDVETHVTLPRSWWTNHLGWALDAEWADYPEPPTDEAD